MKVWNASFCGTANAFGFLAQQKQAHTFLTIRQIFEETLDREGGTLFVAERERNITVSRDIEFLLHNVVWRLF